MKVSALNKITLLFVLGFFLNAQLVLAQKKDDKNEIKKSSKVETIEGKKYYIHTIDKGQTLYAIAHAYGFKVNDIVIENPEAIDGIKPGQTLRIPLSKEKPTPTAVVVKIDSTKYQIHQVQTGETMYSLSKFYNVSIEKINELNPEAKDGLKVGQELKFPKTAKAKVDPRINKEVKTIAEKLDTLNFKKPLEQLPTIDRSSTVGLIKPDKFMLRDSVKFNKDKVFNVALFLPFHVDEALAIDEDKIAKGDAELPVKSEVALQFYHGVVIAIDSLRKSGLSCKLYTYDIDEKDSAQLNMLLKKPELLTMDLIIGPLYTSNFIPLSKYAKENQIYICSPLSQQNKILFNNSYVSKATASTTTQLEQMAEYIANTYKGQNVLIVNSTNPKEANVIKAVKAKFAEMATKLNFKDSITEVKGFGGIGSKISSSKNNIIIMPSNNRAVVTDFVTKLHNVAEKNTVTLFGMQSWTEYENLDINYLNKVQFHYPSSTYIDFEQAATKTFMKKYFSVYKTDPGIYAYQGFDIASFYLKSLMNYGFNFQKQLSTITYQGLQTSFNFYQVSPENGFENRAVYLIKYQDSKLVKVN